jgi:hypothetical protein
MATAHQALKVPEIESAMSAGKKLLQQKPIHPESEYELSDIDAWEDEEETNIYPINYKILGHGDL